MSLNREPEEYIISILRKRLDYLDLDEGTLKTFAAEYIKRISESDRGIVDMETFFLPTHSFIDIPKLLKISDTGNIQRFEEITEIQFLLSSDFFINGSDESKPVKYIRYYDTIETPCSNPFAILD